MKKLEVKLSDEHMVKLDAIVTELQRDRNEVVSRADVIRGMIEQYHAAMSKTLGGTQDRQNAS